MIEDMSYFGYAGSILYVDLTNEVVKREPLDNSLTDQFIGGWGINHRLIWNLLEPGIDPFSPDNPIVIGAGPLAGTVFGGSKIQGTTKFALPATEDGRFYVTSAISGSGRFGLMMKNAGYDHIVITGRAKRPAYLEVTDDSVAIRDATQFWGKKDIYETSDELSRRYPDCGVIAIGTAGENLVRSAMAITDKRMHFGRGGFGAVMGSKNLKAIAARGTRGIQLFDTKRYMNVIDRLYQQIPTSAKDRQQLGSHAGWASMITVHMNPGLWSVFDWDRHYGIARFLEVKKDVKACTGCWFGCNVGYEIKDGEFAGTETETGHFLWPAVFGQRLELADCREALKLLDVANRSGTCISTMGSLIDWITRLYAEGLIGKEQTDGLDLQRDIKTYLNLAEKMINREGSLGKAMADGWFATSEHVGRDARTDYILGTGIAKGTDCIYPARMTKLDSMRFSMGLTNPRGGYSGQGNSITISPFQSLEAIKRDAIARGTPDDAIARIFQPIKYYGSFNVGRLTKYMEDFCSLHNALGTCVVSSRYGTTIDDLVELYSAATGVEMSAQELMKRAERAQNLYKMLNAREGFSKKEDAAFPDVWLVPINTPDRREALTDYHRIRELSREDILKLLDDYYDERGWDKQSGVPGKDKLRELGLDKLANNVIY